MKKKSTRALIGTTIATALAASLCCLMPLLAVVAGISGIASTFTWLEPLRPYLIGLTFIALAVAWIQALKKRRNEIEHCCEDDEKKNSFINSLSFLVIITVVSGLLMTLPYYTGIFIDSTTAKTVCDTEQQNIIEVSLSINDMICSACELHINDAIQKLDGVVESTTSFENKSSIVKIDTSKSTDIDQLIKAVDQTGYTVSEYSTGKGE